MARSRKNVGVYKDRNPWAKRQANKKVRRYKGVLCNGKMYRKLYCSYDICDWIFYSDDEKSKRK